MKPKNFIRIILLVALLIVGLWWFLRPTATTPEKTATAPTPAKADASKTISPSASKPSTTPFAAAQPNATPRSGPSVDPQTDLKTAILDIGRFYRAGDRVTLAQIYTPPDKLDSTSMQQLQALQARSDARGRAGKEIAQRRNEAMAQAFEALENQTPTLNATGDEATYTYTVPTISDMDNGVFTGTGNQISWVFVKINGKWYIKSGAGD